MPYGPQQKKDYDIKINNGYLFNSSNIFKEFVEDMYSLRLKHNKSDPMNFIAKLMMNSLYGRFAMHPQVNEYTFTSLEGCKLLSESYDIKDIIKLDNDTAAGYVNNLFI